MAPLLEDDCDACLPDYMKHKSSPGFSVLVSWAPLILTFFVTFVVTVQKVVPLFITEVLNNEGASEAFSIGSLASGLRRASESRPTLSRGGIYKISAFTVGTTVALTTVLGELVLCEITGLLDTFARASALRGTISLLLILLLTVIPSLEIYSLISSAGWTYSDATRWSFCRVAWILHLLLYSVLLSGFWYAGSMMLAQHALVPTAIVEEHTSASLLDIVTSHVGVIGISLMALLSGFASISAPWHSFFARPPQVSDTVLSRKQAGLDSVREMLATKRSRLRALEQRLSAASQSTSKPSLLEKAASTFRGNPDQTERSNLQIEVSGLENMQTGLSSSFSMLKSRFNQQQRSKTAVGRTMLAAQQVFSFYCVYRVATTTLSYARRKIFGSVPMSEAVLMSASSPNEQSGTLDPLMVVLGLIAPNSLDAAALSRQLTFLLSGLMLLASFSSVLQTIHLFARFAPWLLRAVNKNLPLIVAQVAGTYMISVALLLRGRLGSNGAGANRLSEVGGGELGWVDGWFEGCFLAGACLTAAGIWTGRQIMGGEGWDDESGDLESGKRN